MKFISKHIDENAFENVIWEVADILSIQRQAII